MRVVLNKKMGLALLVLVVLLGGASRQAEPAQAQAQAPASSQVQVSAAIHHDVSPPLRDLKSASSVTPSTPRHSWWRNGPRMSLPSPGTTRNTSWNCPGSASDTATTTCGPAPTKAGLADVVTGGVPADAQILAVPQDRTVVTCSSESAVVCPGGQSIGFTPTPGTTYYYLFKFQPNDAEKTIPEMTGDDLERRGTRSDILNGEPVVLMNFTNSGGDKFHEITRQLAKRGQFRANSEGISNDLAFQHFAIVLDNEIRSWPQIDFTELPDGIAGSSAQIQGLDSLDEAKDLALVLQTGSLPVNFVQVDSTQISATLGKQSLREAWIAAVVDCSSITSSFTPSVLTELQAVDVRRGSSLRLSIRRTPATASQLEQDPRIASIA